MRHRRYDTESLVGDIKREKRNAVLLSLLGLAILVFLVVYFTRLRGPAVPEVPQGAPVLAAPQPTAPAAAPAPQPAPAPAAAPEPPPATDARVAVTLSRPGNLFVDGKLVARKIKAHELQLAPGKHKLAGKAAGRAAQVQLEVVAGKRYDVKLDPRKKKGTVEVAP